MPVGATIAAAAATVGGAVITSGAQKSAATTAANAQEQSSAQQIALLQGLYAQNTANETPYLQSGYGAQSVADLLLGIQPMSAAQFNSGQWTSPGTYQPVTSTGQPIPTTGTGTGTGAGTGSGTTVTPPAPSGYTGPSLQQIMSMPKSQGQAAIDAYMSYYQSHPDQDPGFTNISMFHGDPFVDENSATGVLSARNSYLSAHPATMPTSTAMTPTTSVDSILGTKAPAGYNGVPIAQTATVNPNLASAADDLSYLGDGADSTLGRTFVGRSVNPYPDTPIAPTVSTGGPYTYPTPVSTPTPVTTPTAPVSTPTPVSTPVPTAPAPVANPNSAHPIVTSPTTVAPVGNPFAGLPTNYGSVTGGSSTGPSSITDMIRNTPGYQFQLQQGLGAINSNAYAQGIGNSGLTMKALQTYGQNTADSYYQQYLNNVLGVAAGGASAAGALSGVSQSYGNNATTTMQNSALAQMQAAAARANATGTLANGISSGVGSFASAAPNLFGSSYSNFGNVSTAPYMPNYNLPVTGIDTSVAPSLPGGF